MGWSVPTGDWTPATYWNAVALLNEYVAAINERNAVLGLNPEAAFVVGDYVNHPRDGRPFDPAQGLIRLVQNWIVANYAQFAASHDAGDPRQPGYWTNRAAVLNYATLAEVFAAANLPYSHFRRYVDGPPERGGTVQYGLHQTGDIIGWWLFYDLQALLAVLVHRQRTLTWFVPDDPEDPAGHKDALGVDAVFADAVAEFLALYAAAAWGGIPWPGVEVEPRAWGRFFQSLGDWHVVGYRTRTAAKVTVTGATACELDFYAFARAPAPWQEHADSWSDQGDPVLRDKLSMWCTVAGDPGLTTASETLGGAVAPAIGAVADIAYGYEVGGSGTYGQSRALVRWQFEYR